MRKTLLALLGGLLLVLLGGAQPMAAAFLSRSTPTPFPLEDLLLRQEEFCAAAPCHDIEHDPRDPAAPAAEMATLIGLPTDYEKGISVYFLAYDRPPKPPIPILHAVYRYPNAQQAAARYRQWLQDLPHTLGRQAPILHTTPWSSLGIQGQVLELQYPAGKAYLLVAVSGNAISVLWTLDVEVFPARGSAPHVFQQLLPVIAQRMARAR
ncbi:MAG: hypothetical protein C4313_08230 [Thermoflexus sp.]|uniref:hypothetical protein n=1 Tax=Thermoflexus sp. TaxID=1969742 RepID=UPI0033283785